MTNPGGYTTSFGYNNYGNLISRTDPLAGVTSFEYDAFGLHLLSETDTLGNTTSYTYDNNDRLTKISYADGTAVEYIYEVSTLRSKKDENGSIFTIQHNTNLLPRQVTDALGNSVSYTYDSSGNIKTYHDALGNMSSYTHDGNGNLLSHTNPMGGIQQFEHDERGALSSYRDERGNTSDFLHDGNRFLRNVWGPPGKPDPPDPGGSGPSYSYDEAGRVSVKYSGTKSMSQTYTSDGQLHQVFHNGVIAGTFSYSNNGLLTGFTDPSGSTAYSRDGLDRITQISFPDALTVSYSLFSDGLPEIIHYPDGTNVTYNYDSRRRVTGFKWSGGTISFSRDSVGRVTQITRSNGTTSKYQYDANGRTTEILHQKGPSTQFLMNYQRDASGNVIEEAIDMPFQVEIPEGLFVNTYNSDNQLVSHGEASCSYDAAGNLSAMGDSRNITAQYDAEDRLESITLNGVTSIFSYNLAGHRIRVIRDGVISNSHYDLYNRLLFQTDADDIVTEVYVYDGSRPMAMIRDGECYFYHYDQRGSVVALTDSNGDIAASYFYSPFGRVMRSQGSVTNPFTWLGGFGVISDTNDIYYMTNRHYDARTGRFMQKDPVGFLGGNNIYAYAGNNPVNIVDPIGLSWLPLGDITAYSNIALGVLTFSAKAAALATAPTWGGAALCGIFATTGVLRVYGTFKNVLNYNQTDYDVWDAGADIIDPGRVNYPLAKYLRGKGESDRDLYEMLRNMDSGNINMENSSYLDAPYGGMKSDTFDVSFPEFTIPEFSLEN